MKLLLDTQILIWILSRPDQVPAKVRALIADPQNLLCFCSLSIWEIAIKQRLAQRDFEVGAEQVHRQLMEMKYKEFNFGSAAAIATLELPLIHKDPFDRGLLAVAMVEGLVLVTADKTLAQYPGPIWKNP